jgi:hypothetical protein
MQHWRSRGKITERDSFRKVLSGPAGLKLLQTHAGGSE